MVFIFFLFSPCSLVLVSSVIASSQNKIRRVEELFDATLLSSRKALQTNFSMKNVPSSTGTACRQTTLKTTRNVARFIRTWSVTVPTVTRLWFITFLDSGLFPVSTVSSHLVLIRSFRTTISLVPAPRTCVDRKNSSRYWCDDQGHFAVTFITKKLHVVVKSTNDWK